MRYRVYITPLAGAATYGDRFEITDFILKGGLSKIRQAIDTSDYAIGDFVFDSIQLKLHNPNGLFSLNSDRTIFGAGRDRALVTVELEVRNLATVVFNGIVDELGTSEDARKFRINMAVLSTDAIMRKHLIPFDQIRDGVTFRNAMFTILNTPPINSLLNISLDRIIPQFDDIIDNGTWFTGQSAKTSMDLLLIASGSIMFVDHRLNVHIQARNHQRDEKRIFYGSAHPLRRTPIILGIKKINSGAQRVFNSITVNGVRIFDQGSIDTYGLQERDELELPFITDRQTAFAIAQVMLHEFRYAREEIEIEVLSADVQDILLTDIVRVVHPKTVLNRYPKKFFDLYGQARYGEATYPQESGHAIPGPISWIVYEKRDNPQQFKATLKLRQYGASPGEEIIASSVYALAVYNRSQYGVDPMIPNILEARLPYGLGKYGTAQYQEEA